MPHAAAAQAVKLLTLAQWADLGEDESGELVDGILEEEEMPTFRHASAVAFLLAALFVWVAKRAGRIGDAETKLAVGPRRGRKPDLSVFLPPTLPRPDDSVVRVPAHLVVEVVSPRPRDARRDRIDKLHDYAAAGARHYWIVDPQLRTVEMYRLGVRSRYFLSWSGTTGRVRSPAGFPRFVLDLDALWTHAEQSPATRGRRPKTRRG